MDRYKLNAEDLKTMVKRGLITGAQAEVLENFSRKRNPGCHAKHRVSYPLNGPETIRVWSIAYYGGEHFGQPYHFVAEVEHTTTSSAFAAFWSKHMAGINLRLFNY